MSETLSTVDARTDAAATVETAIAHLYQAAKNRMKSLATRFHPDLQPIGYGVLRFVIEQQPARGSDIALTLGMDKSAVSRHVAQLREMGLIETQQDPADGRATLLVTSPRARAALDAFRSESSSEFGQAFAEWSTDDMREFGRLLTKFNGSIH